MDFFLYIFESLFQDRTFFLPLCLFCSLACANLILWKRKLPVYGKVLSAAASLGLFLWGSTFLYQGELALETGWRRAGADIMAAAVLSVTGIYFRLWFALRKVEKLAEPSSLQVDFLKAWRYLEQIPEKTLMGKQRRRYLHDKIFLLIQMGNFHQAEGLIAVVKDREPAYYFLCQYLTAFYRGKNREASEMIRRAEEACDRTTPKKLKLQILLNLGVQFHCAGDYVNAADALEKAKNDMEKNRIRDPGIMAVLYQNLLANHTMLAGSTLEQREKLLEEYRAKTRMKHLTEYLNYRNTELSCLRQENASREVLNDHARETFTHVMNQKLPKKMRYILESCYARNVWTGALDPEPCLSVIQEDYKEYDKLPPNVRYRLFKELNLFFKGLFGPIVERYDPLKSYAYWYMQNQAEQDLEVYRKELPEEAVYERAFYLKEKAGLQKEKRSETYDIQKVLQYFNDARSLYESNGLISETILLKLDLADEMLAEENMGQDLSSKYQEEIKRLIEEIEAALPELEKQSVLDSVYLRLSFYCLSVDEYTKCMDYYVKFGQKNTSLKHFAPWCHRYYLLSGFAVRILCFLEAIRKLQSDKVLDALEPTIEEWIRGFPHEDGWTEALLFGRFLGFVPQVLLKSKLWMDEETMEQAKVHTWIVFPRLGWEIDPTYSFFTEDHRAHQIFFGSGTHPMEQLRSNRILRSVNRTGSSFGEVHLTLVDWNLLPGEKREFLERLYHILERRIREDCPSLEALQELWYEVMEPVTTDLRTEEEPPHVVAK
ncbi:MAG: hypothetical protein MR562_10400 [Clostridiaceae bacterium]|nr:hypothetical protein [Clostridiaceae bacterium]